MPNRSHRDGVILAAATIVLAPTLALAQVAPETISPAALARNARIQRQLAATPQVLPSLADYSGGLPAYDIRVDGDDGAIGGSLAALRLSDRWAARQAAAAKLAAKVSGVAIDDDGLFATPVFVRSTTAFLTPAVGEADKRDVHDVVAGFIDDHAALFEIDPLEIPLAHIRRDFITRHNGVRHLTYQQRIRGRDLFGAILRTNLTSDGRLINVSSTMLPRPRAADGSLADFSPPAPKIAAAEAIVLAARAAGVPLAAAPKPVGDEDPDSMPATWGPLPELRTDEPVVSTPIFFPRTRDDIRPAFLVIVPVRGVGHTYEIIIDATTGELLHRHNRLVFDSTQPIQVRGFTKDSPAPARLGPAEPNQFQAPEIARDLITITPQMMMPFSPVGWIVDGGLETIGNNVAAHTDVDQNNAPDLPRPQATLVGDTRVFDFPLDTALAPSTYRSAAVAHLFYLTNIFHDRLYALGFDEAAGNFQADNFALGGIGNDAVQADAQDGSGVSNANFATGGTDGSSARMQMYVFDRPDPDRDGSFDGAIVFHELAHGLSIRLHEGLSAVQSRGMGEGWSDFFGSCLYAEPTDDFSLPHVMSGWTTYLLFGTTYTNNYYFGIRRFPYSTNLNVNPLTLADMDSGQFSVPPTVPRNTGITTSAGAVHNVGEIWCNTLLECRTAMAATAGFSANQTMMQLVVDGMKLSPTNPTFTQSRDAILQADLVNNAAANHLALWFGFAKRGMGYSAVAPVNSQTTGVVESFETPTRVEFIYPSGLPTMILPDGSTQLRVTLTPVQLNLLPNTVRLNVSANSAPAVAIPMTETGPGEFTGNFPVMPCLSRVEYWISVETSLGIRTSPPSPAGSTIPPPNLATVFSGTSLELADDFETDNGWTVGPNTATAGLWVRGDPIGTSAQPENDNTPGAGTMCWFTGQGAVGGAIGAADVDNGYTTLTSPVYDLSGMPDARIKYARWYSNGLGGAAFTDVFRIDVSTDGGGSWTTAETIGPADSPDTRPGWRQVSWTLSSRGVSTTSQVRVRFVVDDAGAGSIVEAAIDDFEIEAILCDAPPPCPADFNDDGAVSVQDIFDFLSAYFGNGPGSDFNGDGGVSVQDIFDFLSAYFTGCT